MYRTQAESVLEYKMQNKHVKHGCISVPARHSAVAAHPPEGGPDRCCGVSHQRGVY